MLEKKNSNEPRINNQITAREIRLIGADGEMVGVVPLAQGIRAAEAAGLDLVEISPGAAPPVCKVLDYGKYKYELQKKANEARKKQKIVQIKEIKLRPTIDKHDLEIKLRKINEFLDEGDKVKVSMRFRGREITHQEFGVEVFRKVREHTAEHGRVEMEPRFEGSQMIMILGSSKH
jgi:translation initiation factor IF-3